LSKAKRYGFGREGLISISPTPPVRRIRPGARPFGSSPFGGDVCQVPSSFPGRTSFRHPALPALATRSGNRFAIWPHVVTWPFSKWRNGKYRLFSCLSGSLPVCTKMHKRSHVKLLIIFPVEPPAPFGRSRRQAREENCFFKLKSNLCVLRALAVRSFSVSLFHQTGRRGGQRRGWLDAASATSGPGWHVC
jgi:hypothetical protein